MSSSEGSWWCHCLCFQLFCICFSLLIILDTNFFLSFEELYKYKVFKYISLSIIIILERKSTTKEFFTLISGKKLFYFKMLKRYELSSLFRSYFNSNKSFKYCSFQFFWLNLFSLYFNSMCAINRGHAK